MSTKSKRRLTFDGAAEEAIRWSSDGGSIFFVSCRNGKSGQPLPGNNRRQVWRLTIATDLCLAVTRVADGVGLYDLSKDDRFLYYTINVDQPVGDWHVLRSRYQSLNYGDGLPTAYEVWCLDLDSWQAVKLTKSRGFPSAMALSPDQPRIALVVSPDKQPIHREGWSRIELFHIGTSTHRQLTRGK